MAKITRPCLNCGKLTTRTIRCDNCQKNHDHLYNYEYRQEAKRIRAEASVCWICNEPAKPNDPWQADHVIQGDTRSPLAAAHRSCNIRRSNARRTPRA